MYQYLEMFCCYYCKKLIHQISVQAITNYFPLDWRKMSDHFDASKHFSHRNSGLAFGTIVSFYVFINTFIYFINTFNYKYMYLNNTKRVPFTA